MSKYVGNDRYVHCNFISVFSCLTYLFRLSVRSISLKKREYATLALLHGCFSRFLNCTNGTKSRNAPRMYEDLWSNKKLLRTRSSPLKLIVWKCSLASQRHYISYLVIPKKSCWCGYLWSLLYKKLVWCFDNSQTFKNSKEFSPHIRY